MYVNDFNERMDKAFLDIKRKSYSVQYKAQYDIGGLRIFHFPYDKGFDTHTSDVDMNIQRRRFDAKLALITMHTRSDFRRSPFYKDRHLTYESVAANAHIFPRAFLVFVNGKLVDKFTVEPREDLTCFYVKRDIVKPGDVVSVVFTPNYQYGVFENNYIDIKKNRDYMSYNKLLLNNLQDEVSYISFIKDNVPPKEQSKIGLASTLFQPLVHQTDNIYLNIFGFRHLSDMIYIQKSNLFTKIKRKMPVPHENLLLFEKTINGEYQLSLRAKIKYYYPDIFEIVPEGDITDVDHFLVYVFYNTELDNHVLKYNEQLEKLSELLNFAPSDYGTDEVHPLMKSFIPDSFIYSIHDYDLQGSMEVLDYKLKQMKQTLGGGPFGDPGMLREYLKYRHYVTKLYQIDMKYINVEEKSRTSSLQDVKYPEEAVTFDDIQLVFIFKNEDTSKFLSIRFYIDGLMTMYTHRWKKDIYEYYYIPLKYFKSNSVMDVEMFDTFSEVFSMKLINKSSAKEILYQDNIYTSDDIFMIDQQTNLFLEQGTDYVIKIKNKEGAYEILEPHSYTVMAEGKFYVSIINETHLNRNLLLYIQRGDVILTHHIEENTFDNKFTFRERFSPHKEQVRIHRNRHFLPPSLYDIKLPEKYGDVTVVDPSMLGYAGDDYIVDVTPVHYNVVYQTDRVPTDGFMNLLGIIDKPLSFQWYDFYMNGRKLTAHNVQFISPFIFILQNLRSIRNFFIIEKDRTTNIFDLRQLIPDGDIVHKILELNPKYVDKIKDIDKNNRDVEDSIIGEIIDDKFKQMIDFFEDGYEYDEIRMIHPSIDVVRKNWVQDYPLLFNDENLFIITPGEVITGNTAHIVKLFPEK